MASAKPIPLSAGKGVANRMPETKVPLGYVRNADNVDITDVGTVNRRDGYTLTTALAGAHSLWTSDDIGFALVADKSALYRLNADASLTSLVTGLSGAPVHFVQLPTGVYWSNGDRCGKVTFIGDAATWGTETPSPSFVLSAVSNVGGLDAGTYGVTMTFADSAGEEGGAPATAFVDVVQGGGVQITSVPSPRDSSVSEARIYVTGANSRELFYVASVAPGTTQFIVGAGWRGRQLATQFCQPLPPLRYPTLKAGRLFGFLGSRLVWSEPLYYGLYRPTQNYVGLHGETPTMLGVPDSPRFVAYIGTASTTYVLQGGSLDDIHMSIASHIGVQPGSMAIVEPDALGLDGVLTPLPVWVDKRGVPIAGTEGGLVPLHEKFAYPIYDQAAASFVQIDGQSRYLMGGRGGRPSQLTMADRVVARVYNDGGGA